MISGDTFPTIRQVATVPSTAPAQRPRGRVAPAWSAGRLRLRAAAGVVGALLVLALGGAAWAFWTTAGVGEAVAVSATLYAPGNVVADAPVNSGTVAVAWDAARLSTGQPATGYVVRRVRDSDGASSSACGTSKSTPTTSLSCDDVGVADGGYHYTVNGLLGSWSALSANSPSVTVVNDNSLPTVRVTSISPTPNGNGWNNSSPVTVDLDADAGFGIASLTYAVDGGAPVTVASDTAAVPVTGDGVHTVEFHARDNPGNVSPTYSIEVRIDTDPPAAPSVPVLDAASDSGVSSSDRITKVTTPTLTGTAEVDATVNLFADGALVGTGTAVDGVYTIVSSVVSSGVHQFTARATDQAANQGPVSAGAGVTIDTTAPTGTSAPVLSAASDSGVSDSDRLTNVQTPEFVGAAEAGSSVALYSAATLIGTGTTTDGSYSITASVLSTGPHTVTVTVTDVAGNTSASSPSVVITIDYTAPAKPGTIVLPAAYDTGRSTADKITSVTDPTLTGTTTAATTVTVYDGGVQIGSSYASSTTWSLTLDPMTDGSHLITAKAADAAGNLSVASAVLTIVVDTVAPPPASLPTLVAGTSDTGRSTTDRITNQNKPVFSGTNDSKAIIKLYEAGALLGTYTATASTYAVPASLLSEGTHTVTVTSTDVAGNVGPDSAATTFTIDLTAPAAPSLPVLTAASDTGVSATDRITKQTKPYLSGTAEDDASVRLYDGALATGTAGIAAPGGAYTAYASTTLANGAHTLSARSTDVAGNLSASSPSSVVTVDAIAPTVTVNQAAGQVDPTTTGPIAYTVAFSETVDGFTNTDVTYTGTAAATTTALSGTGPTYDVLASGMTKSGTVIAAVTASKVTDIAGNANVASTATDNTVTYNDVVAPAAPSAPVITAATDSGLSSSDGITNNTKPAFTGTAEVGSTVKIYRDGTLVGTSVAVPASGIYSYTTVTALPNGSYTMTATATDPSSNLSPASSGTPVTIDTIAPTVTLNQDVGQSDPTTTSPINFTVTFSQAVYGFTGTGLTLTGTAVPSSIVAITGTGPYNVAVSGMTRTGTVIPALAASAARDLAGNPSAVATYTDHTVTYTDNVAPTVAITGFVADAGQTASVNGLAGFGLGDNLTVTVVLCTANVFPCTAPNTKATLTGVAVNPGTGAWNVSSALLGTTATLYARATQTDLTGNIGTSAVAGPIEIR